MVLRAQRAFRLWQPGEKVLVGVSGGPDSSALLGALAELPLPERPLLLAAHFDHGLRGPAAAAQDAAAAGELARRLGVPLLTGGVGATGLASSAEAPAREARYAFLAGCAARAGARVVAVGHHRDDRVETVLLRLLRGSGALGAAGMRPSRPLPGPAGYRGTLVRPLWFAERAQILAHVGLRGLPCVEDPSNRDLSHPRNLLRHAVLPALDAGMGPGYRTALLRTAENLAADGEALEGWAEAVVRRLLRGDVLDPSFYTEQMPAAVRHRVLQRWWTGGSGLGRLSRRHADALASLGPATALDLPHGWRARRSRAGLLLERALPETGPLSLPVPGSVPVPGLGRLRARLVAAADLPAPPVDPAVACGGLEGLALPLVVRSPWPGETLRPAGGAGERPLREILRAAGVPPEARRLPRVVTDANGYVLWLAGLRRAAAFPPPGGNRPALMLELLPGDDAAE